MMTKNIFGNSEAAITLAKIVENSDNPKKYRRKISTLLQEYNHYMSVIEIHHALSKEGVVFADLIRDKYIESAKTKVDGEMLTYLLNIIDRKYKIFMENREEHYNRYETMYEDVLCDSYILTHHMSNTDNPIDFPK